jgi:outer membrane protein OmpA-like peptidoglycan-associated protein
LTECIKHPIRNKGGSLKKRIGLTLCIVLTGLAAVAQDAVQHTGSVPIYRITVVARTTKAVNYKHRSGSTKVAFAGTSLLPRAHGTAEVASKQGAIHVEAEFKDMAAASQFGPEYLTYVLWAISPEGRPVNLGEVLLNDDGNSKLNVTSDLQAFGLIVTAEPYFAVTQPSDVVVMENEIRNDTRGNIEEVDAKYELLQRGQYETNVSPAELRPVQMDKGTPIELYEARNAVRIAKWTGADQYASESLRKAEDNLQTAEGYQSRRGNRKAEIGEAREAVQTAEDARVITVKKLDQQRQDDERQASAHAQARTQAEADEATRQKERAESDTARAQSETAAAQAERARAESETAKAKLDMAQNQAASADAVAAAQADADRSRLTADKAEADKAAMRAQLTQQLNTILQTRDSARGLIVNMSDVLFDTGKFSLKSGAREKLAKIAGILLAYPGLNIEIDGYTDSVGSDDLNQTLSENRASSVRDYLVNQGVTTGAVSSKGFGNSQPVASNDNSAGRQMNRRVELVVSGEVIGQHVGVTTGELR